MVVDPLEALDLEAGDLLGLELVAQEGGAGVESLVVQLFKVSPQLDLIRGLGRGDEGFSFAGNKSAKVFRILLG